MLYAKLNHQTQPAERDELRQQASDLFLRFFQQLNGGPTGPWLDLSLSMPQLKMLLIVDWLGPLPMSQLAGRMHVGLSAATGLMDRLVEHGLAQREHDPRDRRVVRVASTPAGRELVARLRSASGERLTRILEHLTDCELRQCVSAVELICRAVEAESLAELQQAGVGKIQAGAEVEK